MKRNIRVFCSTARDLRRPDELSEYDILCFPENPEGIPEEIPGGKEVLSAQKLAESIQSVIILPLIEKTPGGLYSTTAVIDSDGEFLGKYRRVHLTQEERSKLLNGDLGFPVFQTSLCNIGVTMSWDIYHPEVFRILSIDGAEMIFHLSPSYHSDFQLLLKAHSIMNQVVVFGVSPEKSFLILPEKSLTDTETSCFELSVDLLHDIVRFRTRIGERIPGEYVRLCQKPSYP